MNILNKSVERPKVNRQSIQRLSDMKKTPKRTVTSEKKNLPLHKISFNTLERQHITRNLSPYRDSTLKMHFTRKGSIEEGLFLPQIYST